MANLFDEAMAQRAPSELTRGRYAPSPTGELHAGNLRTALLSWLQVRLEGGALILRMEDLDTPRVVEGSASQILDDLSWLGLDWDEGPREGGACAPYTQSERLAYYDAAMQKLFDRGDVFECYCSRKDIREASSAPHGGQVVYPGTCRGLDEAGRAAARARTKRRAAFRYDVSGVAPVLFVDKICGEVREDLIEEVGDFVIKRRDGLFAYQLAVVVDDALMGVTDVVRGEDLLSSTARQIALYGALGVTPPRFWHVPLMVGEDGEKLSKRDGSDSLRELRERGEARPGHVIARLARSMGMIDPGVREVSARELLDEIGSTATLTERLRMV